MSNKRIIVGITGASGVIYARALLRELLDLDTEIHLVVSSAAQMVMREEMDLPFTKPTFELATFCGREIPRGRVVIHNDSNLAAPIASGTFRTLGMVLCPCSMKTLGLLASGAGGSLICRAADTCMKERRTLILVPRETPLNLIHLRNMVSVTEAGAVVLPAMPGFYHKPGTIDDLARHLALKILDVLGMEHDIPGRWKESSE